MQVATLSLADWLFMLFVLATLGCLVTRRDALLPTSLGLLITGAILKGSLIGGLQVAFNAIMAATTDLLNIILVVALIVMLTKTMADMGADKLMVAPVRGLLGNPNISFWVLGFATLLLSWFIWPTPAVALLGAIVLPIAVVGGLPPLVAAMALSIFGKGAGLSSDFVIQGTPAVTAGLTRIPVADIVAASVPVWTAVSLVAGVTAFFIANRAIRYQEEATAAEGPQADVVEMRKKAAATADITASPTGRVMAWVIPLVLVADIFAMYAQGLKGGDATALIGGTVLVLTLVSAVFQYGDDAFKKVMEHARTGWRFSVNVFGPIVIIAAFFWLGGDAIKGITGDKNAQGLMFDWGYYIAAHVPLNKVMVAVMVMLAGVLAAFDGSGYAAIPLGVSIAMALGTPIGADVASLAVLGQMTAIWTGATLVPWGFLAVAAAVAGVDPQDLARRNLLPTILGLLAGLAVTVFYA